MTDSCRFPGLLQEIDALIFHQAKQLRHAAEQAGFAFVPIEVVECSAERGHFILRPSGLGEVHVFAKRDRHWHPFQVIEVERRTESEPPM